MFLVFLSILHSEMHIHPAGAQGMDFSWLRSILSERTNERVILIKLKPGDFADTAFKT